MTRLSEVVTVEEAAVIKGVLPGTVRKRIQRKHLDAVKKGGVWLIRRRDLDAWQVRGTTDRRENDG